MFEYRLIQCDAPTGLLRNLRTAILHHGRPIQEIGTHSVNGCSGFEDHEFGLDATSWMLSVGRERADQIVRGDRHGLGFSHGLDLLHLQDAPAAIGVGMHDVEGLNSDQVVELELRPVTCARRERNVHMVRHLPHGTRVLGSNRHPDGRGRTRPGSSLDMRPYRALHPYQRRRPHLIQEQMPVRADANVSANGPKLGTARSAEFGP